VPEFDWVANRYSLRIRSLRSVAEKQTGNRFASILSRLANAQTPIRRSKSVDVMKGRKTVQSLCSSIIFSLCSLPTDTVRGMLMPWDANPPSEQRLTYSRP
jgi:hypothetical protein